MIKPGNSLEASYPATKRYYPKSMSKLTLLTFLFISLKLSAQTDNYQNLLNLIIAKHNPLFVSSKPIKEIKLDIKDTRDYFLTHKDYENKNLDTVMFKEIIDNSRNVDTLVWKENNFPNSLLLSSRDEFLSKKYAIQKLEPVDKKQLKFYTKQINKFNSTESYNRDIYYYSRPVFNSSKEFAIIQWQNGHSGLGGGGGIILYHFQKNSWETIGTISNWRY